MPRRNEETPSGANSIPFYVCAPEAAMDPALPNRTALPAEQGEGCDITPAALITAFVTERGLRADVGTSNA
jgi:methylthioribose-1-phosphate isomerase